MNMYIYVHKSERKARKNGVHTISQQMQGKCVGKRAIAERESPSETKNKYTYMYIWIYLLESVEIGLYFNGYISVLKTHKNSSSLSLSYCGTDALTFKIMIAVSFNDAAWCWNINRLACTQIRKNWNFMNCFCFNHFCKIKYPDEIHPKPTLYKFTQLCSKITLN